MPFRQEFQAIVLAAGKGSRMTEITAGKPKCLLPVGNKPLVWYPLFKLQQSGFTEVILIVLETQKSEIQATLDKTDLEIKIDYTTIPPNDDLGTADSLKLIQDKIKSDVLVVSCDFVSDVKLKGVLDLFRKHDASVVSLLLKQGKSEQIVVPGPKTKYKPERDLIGIDAQTNRLVFLASASDFETDVPLPNSLIRKHPNMTIYSNLIDAHVYVLKNWVIKYLDTAKSFSTLKGELLPHIVKKQLSKPPKTQETNTSVVNSKDDSDIFSHAQESELQVLIREASAFNDHKGDLKGCYHGDCVRCYAYLAESDVFGVRVNTLPAYWALNGQIIEKWAKITDGKELLLQNPTAEIKSNQVDNRSIIWENCKLNEKTSFKNSIVGANTQVSSFSRVFNCIVMNNVTIKEKVALENSIVCEGATIESGSVIKGCLVGSHHVVEEQSEHANEVLTESERLMEF